MLLQHSYASPTHRILRHRLRCGHHRSQVPHRVRCLPQWSSCYVEFSQADCYCHQHKGSKIVTAWAAIRQVIWLRDLLAEIGYPLRQPTLLYSDNQSCIRLIRSPEVHKRTKHVDIRYHATKDAQASGIINATYIPSAQQLAVLFTKPLPYPQFSTLRSALTWSTH
jgi:hypothetical protein